MTHALFLTLQSRPEQQIRNPDLQIIPTLPVNPDRYTSLDATRPGGHQRMA
jgi:hypothetical protein